MFKYGKSARGFSRSLLILLFLSVPSLSAAAQPSEDPDFQEEVTVSYVIVPFTVFDQKGKPVANLKRDQFDLLVEGRAVDTNLFEKTHDAPISFTILLDGSGSMGLGRKMAGARAALESLVERARPEDDFSLYVFSSGGVRSLVPFTRDGRQLLRRLDEVVPYGKTALYDAIVQMPDETILGTNGVRAIILLTDGLENASRIDANTLRKVLEGVSVPVFPLGLRTPESLRAELNNDKEASLDVTTLATLAGASGGRMAIANDPVRLDDAIADVLSELRAQYIVGFEPTGEGGVRFRSVSLDLERRVGFVRIRAGYRGTAPPYRQSR